MQQALKLLEGAHIIVEWELLAVFTGAPLGHQPLVGMGRSRCPMMLLRQILLLLPQALPPEGMGEDSS